MSVKENLKYHTNFQVIESNVPPKNNRSGYKGVWWDAHRQMWVAYISGSRQADSSRQIPSARRCCESSAAWRG